MKSGEILTLSGTETDILILRQKYESAKRERFLDMKLYGMKLFHCYVFLLSSHSFGVNIIGDNELQVLKWLDGKGKTVTTASDVKVFPRSCETTQGMLFAFCLRKISSKICIFPI